MVRPAAYWGTDPMVLRNGLPTHVVRAGGASSGPLAGILTVTGLARGSGGATIHEVGVAAGAEGAVTAMARWVCEACAREGVGSVAGLFPRAHPRPHPHASRRQQTCWGGCSGRTWSPRSTRAF